MTKIKINKKTTSNLNGYSFLFAQYKMNLKLEEIKLNRNEFHRSSQQIYLNQVYVLFYLRLMDLLSILKTTKKHVIFGLL